MASMSSNYNDAFSPPNQQSSKSATTTKNRKIVSDMRQMPSVSLIGAPSESIFQNHQKSDQEREDFHLIMNSQQQQQQQNSSSRAGTLSLPTLYHDSNGGEVNVDTTISPSPDKSKRPHMKMPAADLLFRSGHSGKEISNHPPGTLYQKPESNSTRTSTPQQRRVQQSRQHHEKRRIMHLNAQKAQDERLRGTNLRIESRGKAKVSSMEESNLHNNRTTESRKKRRRHRKRDRSVELSKSQMLSQSMDPSMLRKHKNRLSSRESRTTTHHQEWFPSMAEESSSLVHDKPIDWKRQERIKQHHSTKNHVSAQKKRRNRKGVNLPMQSQKNSHFHPLVRSPKKKHQKFFQKNNNAATEPHSSSANHEITSANSTSQHDTSQMSIRDPAESQKSLFSSLHSYQKSSKLFHTMVHERQILSKRHGASRQNEYTSSLQHPQTVHGRRSQQQNHIVNPFEAEPVHRSSTADHISDGNRTRSRLNRDYALEDPFDVNNKDLVLQMQQQSKPKKRQFKKHATRENNHSSLSVPNFSEQLQHSPIGSRTNQNTYRSNTSLSSHHDSNSILDSLQQKYAQQDQSQQSLMYSNNIYSVMDHNNSMSGKQYSFRNISNPRLDAQRQSQQNDTEEEPTEPNEENSSGNAPNTARSDIEILPPGAVREVAENSIIAKGGTPNRVPLPTDLQMNEQHPVFATSQHMVDAFQSPAYREKTLYELHNKKHHLTSAQYFSALNSSFISKSPIMWQNPSLKKIHEYRLSTPPLHVRRNLNDTSLKGRNKHQSHLLQRKMKLMRTKKAFWRCVDRVLLVNRWRLSKDSQVKKEEQKLRVVWQDLYWLPDVKCQ